MINGLDLFSGIGGITLALAPWVRPLAYCENDRYAQSVLLSRISQGHLPNAPIWDDVRTLTKRHINGYYGATNGQSLIDIVYGGFPCQDISIAGAGKGLAGERSGLFYEISRLSGELKPVFIFLENVPAITHRGGCDVVRTLAAMGYDCRWSVTPSGHGLEGFRGNRWFCLAKAYGQRLQSGQQPLGYVQEQPQNTSSLQNEGLDIPSPRIQPSLCGGGDGLPCRVDRIRALGNAVVPTQTRKAFVGLMKGFD